MPLVPVGGRERDAGQVESGQQVGVAQLRGEADAEHVEGGDRAVAVHRELGDPVLAHQLFQVRPDAVGALGQHAVRLVQHLVQDLDALVGHADLVGVRVHERPADLRGVPVANHGVQLAADVLDRLAHLGQQGLQAGVDRFHRHPDSLGDGGSASPGDDRSPGVAGEAGRAGGVFPPSRRLTRLLQAGDLPGPEAGRCGGVPGARAPRASTSPSRTRGAAGAPTGARLSRSCRRTWLIRRRTRTAAGARSPA